MIKHLIIIICFTCLLSNVQAQSVNYNQLQNVFNTWMSSKGKSIVGITTQLKAISPKWKLQSPKPSVDGESKYYTWTALDATKDTTAIAVYVEEDNETIKYSLRYAHHSKPLYNSLVASLKSSTYYANGRITTFKNNSKGEFTLKATPDESLPLPKRVDMIVSQYAINVSVNNPALYAVDISSRYIPQQ